MRKHKSQKETRRGEGGADPAEATSVGEREDAALDDASGSEPSGGPALVELPEGAVQRLQRELSEHKDQHLRLAAEFDNFKKRTQRERTETWGRAQAHVVGGILDVLDDLARVAHLDVATTSAQDVLSGVELVERKLLRALESAGLARVGEVGTPFDPHEHEAVTTVAGSAADQDHQVAAVFQAGYRFGGVLLRPARVSVYVWQGGGDGGESG